METCSCGQPSRPRDEYSRECSKCNALLCAECLNAYRRGLCPRCTAETCPCGDPAWQQLDRAICPRCRRRLCASCALRSTRHPCEKAPPIKTRPRIERDEQHQPVQYGEQDSSTGPILNF